MTNQTTIAFTAAARGYTSVDARLGSSWLEPEFQAPARAARAQVEPVLRKLTKAQLADFIADAGGNCYPDMNKADRVCLALILQLAAWYPDRMVTR